MLTTATTLITSPHQQSTLHSTISLSRTVLRIVTGRNASHPCICRLKGLIPRCRLYHHLRKLCRYPGARFRESHLFYGQQSKCRSQLTRRSVRPTDWMAVWHQAGREVSGGGVGEDLVVWLFWKFGIGSCCVCFQTGYFVGCSFFFFPLVYWEGEGRDDEEEEERKKGLIYVLVGYRICC